MSVQRKALAVAHDAVEAQAKELQALTAEIAAATVTDNAALAERQGAAVGGARVVLRPLVRTATSFCDVSSAPPHTPAVLDRPIIVFQVVQVTLSSMSGFTVRADVAGR